MKLNITLGVLAFSLFSALAQAFPADCLLGNWHTVNPIYGRDVAFYVDFNFSERKVDMTVNCEFRNGGYMSATAISPVSYNGTEIYIQQAQEAVVNDGYRYCRATLQLARWDASFDGEGRMYLTVPSPYQTQFVLEKDLN